MKTRTENREHKIRGKKNKYNYVSNHSESCRRRILCTPSNSLGFICLPDTASGPATATAERWSALCGFVAKGTAHVLGLLPLSRHVTPQRTDEVFQPVVQVS